MKALLAAALLATAPQQPSVVPPFPTLKWGMKMSEAKLPSEYEPVKGQSPFILNWTGNLVHDDVLIMVGFTPKTKKLWKVAIIAGDKAAYHRAKSNFETYEGLLTRKYGPPTDTYDFFKAPYEEGDGYEDTALSTGNYQKSSFWFNLPEGLMSIQLTKEGWVTMNYESRVYGELNTKEVEAIKSDSL